MSYQQWTRFQTTLDFDREYLWNGSNNQQAENGVMNRVSTGLVIVKFKSWNDSFPDLIETITLSHNILRFIITMKHVIYGAILSAARESMERCKLPSRVWGRAPAEIGE